jgi:hypothetical protein
MAKIDFDLEFEHFMAGGEGSAIKDIYSIIPSLSQSQMKVIHALMFYIERYKLDDLRVFLERFLRDIVQNKNLGLLSSMNMKNLLKAYTQEELIKGVKANVQRTPDE